MDLLVSGLTSYSPPPASSCSLIVGLARRPASQAAELGNLNFRGCTRMYARHVLIVALIVMIGSLPAARGARPTPQVPSEKLFSIAAQHYGNGKWEDAVEHFRRFLDQAPKHERSGTARFFLGESLIQLGRYTEAREQFTTLQKNEPQHRYAKQALFRNGEAAYLANDFAAAKRPLEHFGERYRHDELQAFALTYLGEIALLEKSYSTAEHFFTESLKEFPQSPVATDCRVGLVSANFGLGNLHWECGELAEAAAAFESAARDSENHPTAAAIALAAGDIHRQLEKWDVAETYYGRLALLEGNQDFADKGLLGRIHVALAQQKFEAVDSLSAEFDKRYPVSPFSDEVIQLRLRAYLQQERFADVLQNFTTPFNSPDEEKILLEGLFKQTHHLEQQQKFAEAKQIYELIVEKLPETNHAVTASLALARTAQHLGNSAEVAERLSQLIARQPPLQNLDQLLYQQAWVLSDQGQQAEANVSFQRVIDQFPNSRYAADAMYRLAEQAWRAGDTDVAARLTARILDTSRDPELASRALYLRGQVAHHAGKVHDAETVMQRLIQEFPDSELRPLAEFSLAESFLQRGETTRAGEMFDKLTTVWHEHDSDWAAMTALRRAQIRLQAKLFDEALAIAAKIAEDSPDFRQQYEVDFVIGRCLSQQTKFTEARAAFERVIRSPVGSRTETAAIAQWMIGESYLSEKNFPEALTSYLRVERLFHFPRWQAAALFQAGKCQEATGNWTEAVKLYAQLIQNYPDSPHTPDASRRLAAARREIKPR